MSEGIPDMTPEQLAAFKAESRAGEVYQIHIAFFVLSVVSVIARLAAARHSRRKIGWDDWLAVTSLVFITGVFAGTMLWLRFGLGRHAIVVEEEDPMNLTRFFQTIYANEILYPMGLASARMSLVILYKRIFGLFKARFYLYGLMGFLAMWAVYATLPTILACNPVDNFWTSHKNCIDLSKLNCFVTIIRLIKVSAFTYADPTWGTVDLMIWKRMESAVICCCLPTLRPLLHIYRCGSNFVETDSNPANMNQPYVYLKMPPQIASRSSEEALQEYDFVKLSLADLQDYGKRLAISRLENIPTVHTPTLPDSTHTN
ncbi:hypothetical protein LY76DRAFT_627517 [Colletotrichum caudatum]|nr:hypothetical protein LY76DRAFT_627517 [Colletotrichum caudatum]